jgi:hypothetical protein
MRLAPAVIVSMAVATGCGGKPTSQKGSPDGGTDIATGDAFTGLDVRDGGADIAAGDASTGLDARDGGADIAAGDASTGLDARDGGADSDAALACTDWKRCGGDVVGTWRYVGSCAVWEDYGVICDRGVVTSPVEVSGMVTYRPDHTFTETRTVAMMFTLKLPTGCYGSGSCAEVEAAIKKDGLVTGFTSFICAPADAGGCNCAVTAPPVTVQRSGRYLPPYMDYLQTSPDNPDGGLQENIGFCIEGDLMREYLGSEELVGGGGSVKGNLFLQRQ